MKVYYFGCWNEAGHYLHEPEGRTSRRYELEYYGDKIHIDGSLAPRKGKRGYRIEGKLVWAGQAGKDDRMRVEYDSDEYPQGQFLLHHLDTGYTAIQWWDRCQGDTRGGCNSTVLMEGKHTADEMLATLREHFPHVVANLDKAGVALVEIVP